MQSLVGKPAILPAGIARALCTVQPYNEQRWVEYHCGSRAYSSPGPCRSEPHSPQQRSDPCHLFPELSLYRQMGQERREKVNDQIKQSQAGMSPEEIPDDGRDPQSPAPKMSFELPGVFSR